MVTSLALVTATACPILLRVDMSSTRRSLNYPSYRLTGLTGSMRRRYTDFSGDPTQKVLVNHAWGSSGSPLVAAPSL